MMGVMEDSWSHVPMEIGGDSSRALARLPLGARTVRLQ